MTPNAPVQVADNPALLEALVEDAESVGRVWVAAEYWRSYCARILRELRSAGLSDFRRNAYVVKGYAATGPLKAGVPRAAWKRWLWRSLEAAPVFSVIVAEYRRLLEAEAWSRRRLAIRLARFALDAVAERFPAIKPPRGIANGNAWDAFQWRGHLVSADWAIHVTRVADFYASVPPDKVTRLIEIGPGLGLATLAHLALNPHLRIAVHVDIVPVVYVSTQFLASCPDLHVVDYLATRKEGRIRLEADGRPTIYQLSPWQLPSLEGPLDFFFNAFSFQEMSKEICANYANLLCRLAARGGLIHAALVGADREAIGSRVPETLAFLESLFAPAFPRIAKIGGFWPTYFEGDPEETRLFLR